MKFCRNSMCGFGKSKRKKSSTTNLKTAYARAIEEAKEKKEQERIQKEIDKDNAKILAEAKKEEEAKEKELEKGKSKAEKKKSIFASASRKKKSSVKRKTSEGTALQKKGSEETEKKKKSGGEDLKKKKSEGAGVLVPAPVPGTPNSGRNRRHVEPREGSVLQNRRRPDGHGATAPGVPRRDPRDYDDRYQYNHIYPEAPSLVHRSGTGGGHSSRSHSRSHSRTHSRHSSRSRAGHNVGHGATSRVKSRHPSRNPRRRPDQDRIEKPRHDPNQPYDIGRSSRTAGAGRYERNDPGKIQGRNDRHTPQTAVPIGGGNVRDQDQLDRDRLNERYGHPLAHHERQKHHSRHINNQAPRLQTRDIHAGQVVYPKALTPPPDQRPVELNSTPTRNPNQRPSPPRR